MSEQTASSLPPTDHLAAFVKELGPCDEPVQVVALAEGHHNQIFLCSGPANLPGQFVLRYPKCPTAIDCLEIAYHRGTQMFEGLPTPQVLHFGRLACNTPVLLEEFIDGSPKNFAELTTTEIGALATTVSTIHHRQSSCFSNKSGEAPICSGTYADYLWAMVQESVIDRLQTTDMTKYAAAQPLLTRGMQKLSWLISQESDAFSGTAFSLLHHDLNQHNILWLPNGRAYTVDWNPTHGDPADDLDYIFTDNRTSSSFKQAFMVRYKTPPGAGDIAARIPAYTLKNHLDDLAWTIMMCEQQGDHYQPAYHQRIDALAALTA